MAESSANDNTISRGELTFPTVHEWLSRDGPPGGSGPFYCIPGRPVCQTLDTKLGVFGSEFETDDRRRPDDNSEFDVRDARANNPNSEFTLALLGGLQGPGGPDLRKKILFLFSTALSNKILIF